MDETSKSLCNELLSVEMTIDYIRGHFQRERKLLTWCGARHLDVDAVTVEFVDTYGLWDPDLLDVDVYGDLIARHLTDRVAI